MEQIRPVQAAADQAEYLLFRTGWDRYWGENAYFGNFPCADEKVIAYLLGTLGTEKKGLGLDTAGIDPVDTERLPRHRLALGSDRMVILENLTNLDAAGAELFTFCALPLSHVDADGSPVRAVGILP